jgi:hypothetical protein
MRAVSAGPSGRGKTRLPISVVQAIPSVISSTRAMTVSQIVPGASTLGKPMTAAL